jgi:hypothetical protein
MIRSLTNNLTSLAILAVAIPLVKVMKVLDDIFMESNKWA